jgi:hypothetical protein
MTRKMTRPNARRSLTIMATIGAIIVSCVMLGPALAKAERGVSHATTATGWSLASASTPGDFKLGSVFANMSCTSASDCFSAGYGPATSGSNPYGNPFIEHWNGRAWSPNRLPTQVSLLDTLQAVECYAPSKCWAVGGNEYSGASPTPILLAWNGSKWHVATGAALKGYISDVSCTGTTFCMGVGWNEAASGAGNAIAEQWNGKTWTAAPTASMRGFYTSLYAVSCWSSSNCLAVGQSEQQGSYAASLLGERWNGKTWSSVTMAQPLLKGYQLYDDPEDISCPASNACVFVGYYSPVLGGRSYDVPILETWNGSTWSLAKLPSKEPMDQPGDISCVSESACWVVGASVDPNTTGPSPAVAFWNGQQLVAGRAADGTASGMLDAVDCPIKTCFALGYTQNGTGNSASVLAERVPAPPPDAITVTPEVGAGMVGSSLPSEPVAYFQDTAFFTPSKDYRVEVEWGDGSSTSGASVAEGYYGLRQCGLFIRGCFKVSAKHTYKTHGTYIADVKVENTNTGAVADGDSIIQAVSPSEFQGPTFPPTVNIGVVDAIGKHGTVDNGCTATALHGVNVIVTARHCGLTSAKTIEFAPYHSGDCIHGSTEVSLQECGGNPDGVFDAPASDVINVPAGFLGSDPNDVDVQFVILPNKNGSGRLLDQTVPGLPVVFNSSIGDEWTVHGYPARDPKRDWKLNSCGPLTGMSETDVPAPEGGTISSMIGLQPCALGANDINPSTNRPYGGESGSPFITSGPVPYGIGAVNLGECSSDGKTYYVQCGSYLHFKGDAPLTVGSALQDGAMNAYLSAVLRSKNL